MAILSEDDQHLHLLAKFHYAVAALAAVCACLPLINMVIGIILLINPEVLTTRFTPFGLESLIGLLFAVMGGAATVIGWALAVCLYKTARYLNERRRWTFCFSTAVATCTFLPFGTILGIFTIVVLWRPAVKTMFGHPAAPASAPPVTP
jgi:hypothetical protein